MRRSPHTYKFIWRAMIRLVWLAAIFFIAVPALADYLGPDRMVTTYNWTRRSCSYHATSGAYACNLTLYYAPSDSCPSTGSVAGYFNDRPVGTPPQSVCGASWPGDCSAGLPCTITQTSNSTGPCSSGQTGCRSTASTSSYPPAAISGALGCSLPGSNGWCRGGAALSLTATEPLSGYSITLIEGTRNGVSFACTGVSCGVPLDEGNNDFTYWALSSWGDSSAMGASSGKLDSGAPVISGGVSGTAGDNGWLVGGAALSASAYDPGPVSGLASFVYSIDGGPWTAYSGGVPLPDGVHTLNLSALDAAGNAASASVSARVDTGPPASSFTASPPGWARGTLGLSGASSDATSGIASVELSLNGGASWQALTPLPSGEGPGVRASWGYSWDTTSVSDGSHTLLARAADLAGNQESTASLTVNVDNTPPGVVLSGPPSFCPSCTTNAPLGNASLSLSVSDASSGIGSWSLSAGATVITSGSGAASQTIIWNGSGLGLGAQTLVLTATDIAGNTNSVSLAIRLVAAPPDPEPTAEAFSIPVLDRNPGAIQELPQQPTSIIVPARQQAIVPIVPEPAADPADSPAPLTGAPAFPDILWGTAAAAAIGAATAVALDEQRKRKQEQAQAAAEAARANREASAHEQGFESYQAQVEHERKVAEDLAFEAAVAAWQAAHVPAAPPQEPPIPMPDDLPPEARAAFEHGGAAAQKWIEAHAEDLKAQYQEQLAAERVAHELAVQANGPSAGLSPDVQAAFLHSSAAAAWVDANQAMLQEQYAEEQGRAQADPTWWHKAWDGVKAGANKVIDAIDHNQALVSIGIGLVVGLGAVAIIATGGLATPLVIAGAAVVAGGLTAGMTVGLNAHYDRPLDQNLIRNVGYSAVTAAVVAVAPTFIQTVLPYASLVSVNLAGMAGTIGGPALIHAITVGAPWVGFAWSALFLGGLATAGIGVSTYADPTLSEDQRQRGAVAAYTGMNVAQSMTDLYQYADLANEMSPFKVRNEAPQESGLTPIVQRAIANSIDDDGTIIAVRAPADDAEFGATFLPQKPEGSTTLVEGPLGIRKVELSDGSTQWVVSDLDPAWGMDANGELLPENYFVGPAGSPSFSSEVNSFLGYDAVQHPDHVNFLRLHPDKVPYYDQLFEPVTLMDANGYVGSSETMLDSLLDYNPNGAQMIQKIVDAAPPHIAQRIIDFLAGRQVP